MKARVNYRDIAKSAGVSLGTVSLALRNHPSIPLQTQERIKRVAEELGYRPNPRVAELMGEIRRNRSTDKLTEAVALFWSDSDCKFAQSYSHLREFENAIREHLRSLGYDLAVFYEDSGNVERILRARGIRGLILAPLLKLSFKHLNWNWSSFSVVIAGSGLWRPEFHRVRFNHFEEMALILHELRHLHAKKVALLTNEMDDRRSQRTMAGGFLAHAGILALPSESIFAAGDDSGPAVIKWLRKHQPEVLILGSAHAVEWVEQAGIKTKLVFLSEYLHGKAKCLPGIRQDYAKLGRAAAAQLFGQLAMNQAGIPPDPIKIYITGTWYPGAASPEAPKCP